MSNEDSKIEYKIEITDKDNAEGIINKLKKEKGINVNNISDRTFENKLLDSAINTKFLIFQIFGNILKNLFKPSKKDREIKTKLQFFKSNKPNNRGSYISDFVFQ